MLFVKTYTAKLKLNRLDGGIPCDPDIIKKWLSAHGIQDDAELADRIANNLIEEDELEEALRILTTAFMRNSQGQPVLENRCIQAAIRQGAEALGIQSAYPGIREVIRTLRVEPELVPVAKDKSAVTIVTRPCHVMTAQGPRSSLKRFQMVEGPEIEFDIAIADRAATVANICPKKKVKKTDGTTEEADAVSRKLAAIDENMLKTLLEYTARFIGFGANHSQDSGHGELVSLTLKA